MYACDNCGTPVPVRTLPYTLCDICQHVENESNPDNVADEICDDDERYGSWEEYCEDCDEQDARSYYDEEFSANEYFEG